MKTFQKITLGLCIFGLMGCLSTSNDASDSKSESSSSKPKRLGADNYDKNLNLKLRPEFKQENNFIYRDFTAKNGKKLYLLMNPHPLKDGMHIPDEVAEATYDGEYLHILGEKIKLNQNILLSDKEKKGLQLVVENGEYVNVGMLANFVSSKQCNSDGRHIIGINNFCTNEGEITFIEGELTPIADMPNTDTIVRYENEDGSAEVNFKEKSITGKMLLNDPSYKLMKVDAEFKASITGNTFSSEEAHKFKASGKEYSTSVMGGFYGPAAAEMAGEIELKDNKHIMRSPFLLGKEKK